jgi:hypothetical protein
MLPSSRLRKINSHCLLTYEMHDINIVVYNIQNVSHYLLTAFHYPEMLLVVNCGSTS